ncbi:sigma-70 family RNA polymerase sigma factor [uncultured Rikenella sp.]|uniref:RNA polymerase sigma factor n=1 Tax=uncultured Rikenella sp. TaxID=368003 RepID=UPI00261850B6|nr:sigma-70 family RNA polymerase sigma factor [uncultured Rikenella sp.]
MTATDDTRLLDRLRSADPTEREAAFVELVDRYSQRIYWTVRKLVVSHHDTDDVVQNVFLKVWNAVSDFRGESGLFTWLYRIAVNESLSLLRSRRSGLFASLDDGGAGFDRIAGSEGLIDGEGIERALARAVSRLPAKQRAVFTLRYWDEMPYEEMSAVLETSVGALKASYHHAAAKVERWVREEWSGSDFTPTLDETSDSGE